MIWFPIKEQRSYILTLCSAHCSSILFIYGSKELHQTASNTRLISTPSTCTPNLFLTHLSSRLVRSYFVHSSPILIVQPTIRPIRRVVSRSLSVFLPRRSAFRSNRRPLWFLCELRFPSVCSVLCSLWSEKWVDLLHYQHYIYLINTHIHRVSCSHAMGESCWVAFFCWWRAVRFFLSEWNGYERADHVPRSTAETEWIRAHQAQRGISLIERSEREHTKKAQTYHKSTTKGGWR